MAALALLTSTDRLTPPPRAGPGPGVVDLTDLPSSPLERTSPARAPSSPAPPSSGLGKLRSALSAFDLDFDPGAPLREGRRFNPWEDLEPDARSRPNRAQSTVAKLVNASAAAAAAASAARAEANTASIVGQAGPSQLRRDQPKLEQPTAGRTINIYGLADTVTDTDFRRLCERAGPVAAFQVLPKNAQLDYPCRDGSVTYHNPSDARRAFVELNLVDLHGIPIGVAWPEVDPLVTPRKRTHAEIEANKAAALAKRQAAQLEKQRAEAAAQAAKKLEANRRFGQYCLEGFGFSVGTRYGSGSGGVKEEQDPLERKARMPWAPNESCSEEQRKVLDEVMAGKNVFFTGSAGVGKSFLLNEITRMLEHVHRPFQVTATTGIASLQVGGMTLHSWSGVGLGKEPLLVLVDRIKTKRDKLKAWQTTQVLIIDEVSMLDPDLWTKISLIGKMIKSNNKPFGGLQIIVSGDFFQLPPVPEKDKKCPRCANDFWTVVKAEDSTLPYEELPASLSPAKIFTCSDRTLNGQVQTGCGLEQRKRSFVFETETWAECNFKVMELTKVFRQSDAEFVGVLNKLRRGVCDDDAVKFLSTCGTALQGDEIKIKPTRLYPHRRSVDEENNREYALVKDVEHRYSATDASRGQHARLNSKRLDDTPPTTALKLKMGAQVMLLCNLDLSRGLVNGSRGVVVDWVKASDAGGRPAKSVKGGAFGGEEWREKAALEFLEKQEEEVLPQVYFASGVELVIHPHTWVIDLDKDNTLARTQLPLALAWALTIHKSQGQSLDAVGVKLEKAFENGQAYVALSRCRTPAGMKVEGFKQNVVKAHPTVVAYYDRIADGLPFHLTPPRAVNPLAFVPEFSPYLTKLSSIFGLPPRKLPRGSPLLAPGQKPPSPVKHKHSPSKAGRSLASEGTRTPAKGRPEWMSLLKRAAEAYVQAGNQSNQQIQQQLPYALVGARAKYPAARQTTPPAVEEAPGTPTTRASANEAQLIDLTTDEEQDEGELEVLGEAEIEPPAEARATVPAEEQVFDEVVSSEDEDETQPTQEAGPVESGTKRKKKASAQRRRKRNKRVGR